MDDGCEDVLNICEGQSAWQYVLANVPASEHGEVTRIVGEHLVDEVVSLHTEATALLDIWRAYRSSVSPSAAAESHSPATATARATLPEHPGARDLLKREIAFFAASLRSKDGVIPGEISRIVDYATQPDSAHASQASSPLHSAGGLHSRPSTASSRPRTACLPDGREVPLRAGSAASSRASTSGSQTSEKIGQLNSSLNAFDIDTVVEHIREVLQDEKQQLLDDITFLQECLEGEHEFQCAQLSQSGAMPSLRDLRECRSTLETAYLKTKSLPSPSTTEARRPTRTLPPQPKAASPTQQSSAADSIVRPRRLPAVGSTASAPTPTSSAPARAAPLATLQENSKPLYPTKRLAPIKSVTGSSPTNPSTSSARVPCPPTTRRTSESSTAVSAALPTTRLLPRPPPRPLASISQS